jgi:predicted branched-subunit amino acid permease
MGIDAQHRQLVNSPAADDIRPARRAAFHAGRLAILPFMPGTFAWGMISGVAMVKSGLPVPWAIAMSLLVCAGSAQLAALPLIAAGAPIWVIVATGFITNLRFVIYSAAIRPYFEHHPLGLRVALGFFMTDFTFVRFMRSTQDGTLPGLHRDAWFAGMCSTNFFCWQTAAIVGCIGASYVPTDWGLEFTGTLALVALVGPSLNARPAIIGAVVAGVIALLAHGLPFKLGLFCAAIAGIIAASLADAWQPRDPAAAPERT